MREEVLDNQKLNTKKYIIEKMKDLNKLSEEELKKLAEAGREKLGEAEEETDRALKGKHYVK